MCICLRLKYPLLLSYFNETRIFLTDFRNKSCIKFHENPSSGSHSVPRRGSLSAKPIKSLIPVLASLTMQHILGINPSCYRSPAFKWWLSRPVYGGFLSVLLPNSESRLCYHPLLSTSVFTNKLNIRR